MRPLFSQVAIKVLPASVAGDSDRLARFQREAEVLAALNHPNIAGICGLEWTPDLTAFVMELVEGDDLSMRIAKGAIPICANCGEEYVDQSVTRDLLQTASAAAVAGVQVEVREYVAA